MASRGVGSRRKAEEMIAEGRVRVNGRPAELATPVDPQTDQVLVDGKEITLSRKIYILLNKPRGYLSTCQPGKEEGRSILDLIGINERIYPVGRLDRESRGLLILTNDGEFANQIMHPSSEIEKEYIVKINKRISDKALAALINGVTVDDYIAKPKNVEVLTENPRNSYISITLTEGKNREIRKMFDVLGYRVQKLKRIRIGNIDMGFLKKGDYRYLIEEEIKDLKVQFKT